MQKKILFTFLLIAIIICIFTVSSYAAYYEFKFTFKDKEIDLPDVLYSYAPVNLNDYKYFTLVLRNDKYWFYVSNSPLYLSDYKTQWSTEWQVNCAEGKLYSFVLPVGGTSWEYNYYESCPYSSHAITWNPKNFLYCNYDLKYNGETVVEAYVGSLLVKSISSISTMDTVTSEIVYILPVTLTITVGLISIRKAIAFIRNKLRNA